MRLPVLLDQERLDEAVDEARTAVRLWFSSGSRGLALVFGADFAEALVRGGAPAAEALEVLDAHRALADETRSEHRRAQNGRVRTLLAERGGSPGDALALLDDAVAVLERCGSRIVEIRALRDRARMLRTMGRDPDADAAVHRLRALCAESGVAARL